MFLKEFAILKGGPRLITKKNKTTREGVGV